MKMKIERGSIALIKYNSHGDNKIIEGRVVDAKADCVKVKTVAFGIGPIKWTVTRWYSFSHPHYTLVVEQLPS